MTPPQPDLPLDTKDRDLLTVYTDGASRGNPGESGIGVVISKNNTTVKTIKTYLGKATNNQAEYAALIAALEAVLGLGKHKVRLYTDSQLMANQINGLWKVKHPDIKPLYKKAMTLIGQLPEFRIQYIPRELNTQADRLANQAIDEYS